MTDDVAGASDVIVVGGGIIGCATALELAKSGFVVRLIERGELGREQSSRAWGLIRQQGRHPAEIPLAADALSRWPHLASELGMQTDFIRSGILVAAESAADEERLAVSEKIAKEHGVRSRLIGREEICKILPDARPIWSCGLFSEDDGHAEPERASRAFAEAARRAGVDILANLPVIAIDVSNGVAAGVQTTRGRYQAPIVLCSGGVGAADLMRTVGIDLPIQPVRSSVGRTHPTRHRSRVAAWSPRVAFRPRADGSYNFSNGYHTLDSEYDIALRSLRHFGTFFPAFLKNYRTLKIRFGRESLRELGRELTHNGVFMAPAEPPVNRRWVRQNFEQFLEVFPDLRDVGIATMWAGRIDTTPDLIPILGSIGGISGLFVAAGFSAHGFSLAPTVGRLLAQAIRTGATPAELRPFRYERFEEGEFGASENALV